jgi:hypothetical protein
MAQAWYQELLAKGKCQYVQLISYGMIPLPRKSTTNFSVGINEIKNDSQI